VASLNSKRQLLKEGTWVTIGQIGSALGTLIGIRILTEYVVPEIFGAATLIIGIASLALGTLVSPILQAALKYYPEYSNGRLSLLRASIRNILIKRIGVFLLIAALATPFGVMLGKLDISVVLLCLLLLVLDGMRNFETTLLNAARKHTCYAMVSVAEAWGRPITAVFAVNILGADITSILMAYALTSSSILLFYYALAKSEVTQSEHTTFQDEIALKSLISKYSRPLVPMSALGWMNGIGDRYLIGALLGLEAAGIYAAVYGLMSRPFLMVSGIVELTLRPLYNQLVAGQKDNEAQNLLRKWLLLVVLATGAGFVCIALFDTVLIKILLAEKYRSGVTLMLWIAGGYVLLALSDVFVKVCYAYGYTGRILVIQVAGAVISLISAFAGIKMFGLVGAAMAVPVYFGAMLIITYFAAIVKMRNRLFISTNLPSVKKITLTIVIPVLSFFAVVETSTAKTYYVDSFAGDDANKGITEAAPWKSIRRVNLKRYVAGDTVLFKRGGEWFDVMINVESPDLTFGAYGSGVPPRLVGSISVKIGDWKKRGSSIYYAYFPRPQTRKDWTNWEVQLVMESGYEFYKKVASLDELNRNGQFFYDKYSQNLYIRPLDPVSSLSKTFYIGRQENIFEIKHAKIDSLIVRDLEIALANRYGIGVWWQGDKVTQGSVFVENNIFIGNAFSAVCLSGGMSYDKITIRNNTIRMSGAEGVYIGRYAARTSVELTDNIVGDIADLNFGWRGEGPTSAFNGDGLEVKTGNHGLLIARNKIRNLGYSGCGICTGSTSAVIIDNLIDDIRLPGMTWSSPAAGIFVDMDDSLGVPIIKHNKIFMTEASGIHVRGNGKIRPPLVIEDNELVLTQTNPNAQIHFSVLNSRNVKVIGNRGRGGAYGLAFAPADDPPDDYLIQGNDFLETSKSPFYFAQSMPSELRGMVMNSNRVCKKSPTIIEWKSGASDKTIAEARKVLGPHSIIEAPCP
jgi:O-antigen/teichoic acid export membrane protein